MVKLRVKEICRERGINMSKLSRMADVSYGTIEAIFRDPHHDASLYILERIAGVLEVSICDLIEEEKTRKRGK